MKILMLSRNFSLQEFIHSQTAANLGIDNMPDKKQVDSLQSLCMNVLQEARDVCGPIFISSGFRCKELNEKIGGSKTSQHMKGQAADISSRDNSRLFHHIRQYQYFDQLIWEFGDEDQPQWVHVSYNPFGKNRRQVLRAVKDDEGKTKYEPYYVEQEV